MDKKTAMQDIIAKVQRGRATVHQIKTQMDQWRQLHAKARGTPARVRATASVSRYNVGA